MTNEILKPNNTLTNNIGSKAQLCYNFINDNYKLRLNMITGNIEDGSVIINGNPKIISDREINTIYIKLSNITKDVSKEFLTTFIFSEYIPMYNPFIDFFEKHENYSRSQQLITDLANTITTDSPAEKFIKHWGCGMIASVFGSQSPLTLVLAGEEINLGKTEWFRRLLPDELKLYYAESKLDDGKDSDILMCKKLIIMDDEFGGKNKTDDKRFKGLTSKQTISIRLPYGKTHIELRRLCSLGGTSNRLELLSDPYGNRRVLPINVTAVNHELYNSIDKIGLMMAFYDLYKTGFHWKFKKEDIDKLNMASESFESTNSEAELIDLHFDLPENDTDGEWMTNTQIKIILEEKTKQKIWDTTKLGIDLRKLGFIKKQKKINKVNAWRYYVKTKIQQADIPYNPYPF